MHIKNSILSFVTMGAISASAITITWDLPDPSQGIEAVNIYEFKGLEYTFTGTNVVNNTGTNVVVTGTNWVLVGSVPASTNSFTLTPVPGLHLYAAKTTNSWGESPFSNIYYGRQPGPLQSLSVKK